MGEKRKRSMLIEISDEDMKSLLYKAGTVGLTPEQLLERFIFDLVGSSEADGSASGHDAGMWFGCSWFSLDRKKTLLCYLLGMKHVWDFEDVMEWLCIVENHEENIITTQEQLDNGNYPWEEVLDSAGMPMYKTVAEWENDEKKFIEQERIVVAHYRKILKNVWRDFCEWTDIELGEMEDEFCSVLEWYRETEKRITG